VLEHKFARIRCDAGAHEYLLAFACTCRDCCPSCLAAASRSGRGGWTPRASRPCRTGGWCTPSANRLRASCLSRRRLLGEIARGAARTVTAAVRTRTGTPELVVRSVASLQARGSRTN